MINNQHTLYLHGLYRNTAQLLAKSMNIEYWDCHFDNLLGLYRKQQCNALDSFSHNEEHNDGSTIGVIGKQNNMVGKDTETDVVVKQCGYT